MPLETFLKTTDAHVNSRRKFSNRQWQMRLGFDDVHGRPDTTRANRAWLRGDRVTVPVVGGKQKSTHQTVREGQPDQRSSQ